MAFMDAAMLKRAEWPLFVVVAVVVSGNCCDAGFSSSSNLHSSRLSCHNEDEQALSGAGMSPALAGAGGRLTGRGETGGRTAGAALLQQSVGKHSVTVADGAKAEGTVVSGTLHGDAQSTADMKVQKHALATSDGVKAEAASSQGVTQDLKTSKKEAEKKNKDKKQAEKKKKAGGKAQPGSSHERKILHSKAQNIEPSINVKEIVQRLHKPDEVEVGGHVEPEPPCRGNVYNNHSDLSTVNGEDFMLPICGGDAHQVVHTGGQNLLLLVPIFLAIGCLTSYGLKGKLSALPYTCVLFVEGFFIAIVHRRLTYGAWNSYDVAYSLFGSADPHLILFIFLPALIFGESMSLNSNMVQACLPQCLLLAGPGVLIGTVLTGAAAKYILPYGWDWSTAMLLGSILAATDPVAVVSIFKSMGVSPRLTMLVSGESLLNDGVAIVLFQLFIEMSQGVTPTAFGVVKFFSWMITVGPLFGMSIGLVAIWALGRVSYHGVDLHGVHGDSMIQVITTFVCAYLSFFVAESELHTSGVLSLVACGTIMASYVWPRFNSRETLQDIWHVADFIGNTLIFMLAGLILGDIVASRHHIITGMDCLYLLVIYVLCTIIRGIMVLVLWIPLNHVAQPISKNEAAVMVWSGLRGAVGLLMAVVADRTPGIGQETGTRILFYVGGMAALMLIANGTLTPVVLQICGFRDTTNEQAAMLLEVQDRLAAKARERLEAKGSGRQVSFIFEGARLSQLPMMIHTLTDTTTESTNLQATSRKGVKDEQGLNYQLLGLLRDTVRTMTKSVYWEMCETGLLPRSSVVTKVLMDSTDVDKMSTNQDLDAWATLKKELMLGKYHTEQEWRDRITVGRFVTNCSFGIFCQRGILASLAFIHAHEEALTHINEYWGTRTQEEDKIDKEIEFQTKKAKTFLETMPKELVVTVKTKLLASDVLHFQIAEIRNLMENGVVTPEQGHELQERVSRDVHSNWEGWEDGWEDAWQ